MKPRNKLIGILTAIALPVIGLVQGCQPLSNVQEQKLEYLTGLAINHQEQQARNQAIREAGTQGPYQGKDSRLYGVNSPEELRKRRKYLRYEGVNSPEELRKRRDR